MKAVCPLHGPTTIIGTNAYGFPVYACCCDDVPNIMHDACTREPASRKSEPPRQIPQPKTRKE